MLEIILLIIFTNLFWFFLLLYQSRISRKGWREATRMKRVYDPLVETLREYEEDDIRRNKIRAA